ncbi:MAG: UDP-N-acetylmuramoyl-tripeptide--D-alanyl-D-alanine ligase [Pseudomonadota bacterium]
MEYRDIEFEASRISIDTRTLRAGDVYIAIQGEAQDGHNYVQAAKDKGAVAAIVSKKMPCDILQIIVPDTTIALGEIAAQWRQQFSIPIIAITGSVGKTTTRNMIAKTLIEAFGEEHVLVPQKNFNNHWGLPLVLCRLNSQHKIAVLEMGMNHLEEIRYLMKIAQPTIGVITNAGTNHIGLLGSQENIAKAKGEMFEELSKTGCAVINADDRFYDYWKNLLSTQKMLSFGLQSSDITAKNIQANSFILVTPVGEIEIKRILLGQHNILNALAATAAVFSAGLNDLHIIKQGLEAIQPEHGRLEPIITSQGVIVLNDTYNGGETSTLSALQVLSEYPMSTTGKKIAVIGDMAELEDFTIPMHKKMGEHVSRFVPDIFIAFGPMMKYAYDNYSGKNKQHFVTHDEVAGYLKTIAKTDDVVLLKGARAMAMEKIFQALVCP